ncbi:MAG: DUF2164 domain-containing protein [Geobacteraceae bacterium]|nr:DUF2164 domain-containing protein [Geobacteraceae bacterium]
METNQQIRTVMDIKLSKDVESNLVASIKRYVSENFETDIGDLQSSLFLQFCLEEIGPFAYNQAILDAQVYMQERLMDLETSCYASESTYWTRLDKKKTQRLKK